MKIRQVLVLCALAVLARPWSVEGQVLTATLSAPSNGAANVTPVQTMQWTSVAGAQAYVLWVGTTVGAKNVINTPEILQTSYQPAALLPSNQALYARMWTEVGNVWRFVDSTFTTGSVTATLTSPANGASSVSPLQTMQWTSVPAVQAYVLWIGTTASTNNVVNTPEILQTSYQPANLLPSSQTLYARMWTKVGNQWRFVDSTFTTTTLTSTLTAPANAATNVSPSQLFQWTSVLNAQAYVLWIGTTVGAKNVVNTPEIHQTSYQPANLLSPSTTLYARMWAEVGGVWRFTDSTFTTAALTPTLTAPANGATSVSPSQAFQWTSVLNAQAYVLWVGTTVGANNLVNTPEIQQTSYQPANLLPPSTTLYARTWAKVGGVWRFTDSTFTTASLTATLTAPVNGATNVNPLVPIQWTSVPNAQAYVLWVGTSAGASNVVNTPETLSTSYQPASLPANQTLFARMWTKVGNVWRSTDSTFSAAALVAQLTYPANGATNVDDSLPATWNAIPGATAYVLYVGSTQGANNYLNGPEVPQPSYPFVKMPPNQVLHARLWTYAGGVWRYSDSTFSVSPLAPAFTYPLDGAIGVNAGQSFTWTTSRYAEAYSLSIGTSAGANDVLDSGELAGTNYLASGLTTTGPLYARVWAKVNGQWTRHSDIGFTLDSTVAPAIIEFPFDGQTDFFSGQAFQWPGVTLARGYQLSIGTTPGGNDLHDSGEIHVTRRFVHGLPTGALLYGRLQTKAGGLWSATDFTFTVADNTVSPVLEIKSALWATDVVRTMAGDSDSHPFGWTLLSTKAWPSYQAICSDFSAVLLQVLGEMNLGLPYRDYEIAFDTNGLDGHTLVEVEDPATGDWMLLDPTFDLTVRRLNGTFATADDVSQTALASNWTGVTYELLGTAGNLYATSYYLDYPLLFLNIAEEPMVFGVGNSPLPYLEEITLPVAGLPQPYIVRCAGSTTTQVVLDGSLTDVACTGIDSLSPVFYASSVSAPSASPASFQLYRLRRFVF